MIIKVLLLAKEGDWQLTPVLHKTVSDLFSGVICTKVNEDGFRSERGAEELASYNHRMSNKRKWVTLIQEQVARKKHRYDELPGYEDLAVPRGFKDRDLSSMYVAKSRDAKLPLHTLVNCLLAMQLPQHVCQ